MQLGNKMAAARAPPIEDCLPTQRRSGGMLAARLAVALLLHQLSTGACLCPEQDYDQVDYIAVSGQSSTQSTKWRGGVIYPTTGVIYGIPFQAKSVLRIDPATDTATVVAEGTVQCKSTGSQGCWDGGVLSDNYIYGIPSCAEKIFQFNPAENSVVYFGAVRACQGSGNWRGGVSVGGKIFGIPLSSDNVLVINPTTQTVDTIDVSSASGSTLSVGWSGGVFVPQQNCPSASPTGCILGAPYTAAKPLLINPSGPTAKVLPGTWSTGSAQGDGYQGGVYAPLQSTVIFIPWGTTEVLSYDAAKGTHDQLPIDMSNGAVAAQDWLGGVLNPHGVIYGIPYTGTQVLKINPHTNEASTFGSIGCGAGNTTAAISTKPCKELSGGGWWGGVLSKQGAIYCIPSSSPNVLKIGGHCTSTTAPPLPSNATMTGAGVIVGSVFGTLALLALVGVSVLRLQRRGMLRCCWATHSKGDQLRGTELMTNGYESSDYSLINPLNDTTQSTLSAASVNAVPFSGNTLSGTTLSGATLSRTMDVTPDVSTTETAFAFSAKTISSACNGFRAVNLLGEGAFGVVYRGVLPLGGASGQHGGREVAIKVLKLERMARDAKRGTMAKRSAYSGQAQFKREAEVLGKYRHPNIVALLGHCVGDKVERPCLVCEFMPGQSLKKRLRDGPALTWQERHVVASDLARGLVFLHKEARPPVIHQDVKPDNIMLGPSRRGDGLVAKLVDFGIARIAPELAPNKTASHLSTRTRAGTAIYMPYEYHMAGRVSVKTDAYAFGIVLLQVLTGRPPSVRQTHEPLVDFIYDKILHPKRHMAELVDKTAGNWDRGKWCALLTIARQCSEHMATERLAVADVLVEVDTLAGRSSGRWGGLNRGGGEYSASSGTPAARAPLAGARTVRAAISRNIYSGAGLVGVRIQVVGRGTGTVVDICHVRGKPTQHVVLFDNGSRELLTLSKDPTNPTKRGHKFYVVS